MTLRAPFPWFGEQPSLGMLVALDLVERGVLTIDSDGRIWRRAIKNHGAWLQVNPRRAENVGGKGYLRLTLQHSDGSQVQVMAHRVVWAVAHQQIPAEGLQINHDDLKKQNNHPDNLILCTGQENIQHSYAHGRTRPWSMVGARSDAKWRDRPLVDNSTKQDIRAARAAGTKLKNISERFGISITHVHRLCK